MRLTSSGATRTVYRHFAVLIGVFKNPFLRM